MSRRADDRIAVTRGRRTWRGAALLSALLLTGASSSSAQSVPGFGGIEVRGGIASPEAADIGGAFGLDADLGYLLRPPLRLLVRFSRFDADIDREPGSDEGSYRATGIGAALRYDFLTARSVAPYLLAGVNLHRVSADAFDTDVAALLDGTYAGFAAAVGARYLIDDAGRISATAEVRRSFVNNIGHTTVEVGVRWQPRGWRTYRRELPERSAVEAPAAAERQVPVTQPVPAAPRTTPPLAADTADARRQAEATRAASARRAEVEREEQFARERLERLRATAAEAMLGQGLTRAAAAMPAIRRSSETSEEFEVTLGGNAFASGTSMLTPSVRDQLRVLATVLAGYPGHIVLLEGHADATGDPAVNQTLSEERAAVVRAALIVEGVDPLWIGARGLGAGSPIASNATSQGRALNRRVEIRVSKRRCSVPPVRQASGELVCMQ